MFLGGSARCIRLQRLFAGQLDGYSWHARMVIFGRYLDGIIRASAAPRLTKRHGSVVASLLSHEVVPVLRGFRVAQSVQRCSFGGLE
jgi:hypothetical protein